MTTSILFTCFFNMTKIIMHNSFSRLIFQFCINQYNFTGVRQLVPQHIIIISSGQRTYFVDNPPYRKWFNSFLFSNLTSSSRIPANLTETRAISMEKNWGNCWRRSEAVCQKCAFIRLQLYYREFQTDAIVFSLNA